jgi:hypothetical protein
MGNFLKDATDVPFDSLYLDPNNPRLGLDDKPGYEDPEALFDDDLQPEVEKQLKEKYGDSRLRELRNGITSQGWLPVDSVITWAHPDDPNNHVVVEGNTRVLVLKEVRRKVLDQEKEKLDKMKSNSDQHDQDEIDRKQEKVDRLKQIITDTEDLEVKPIEADSIEELEERLPRVLSVRHVTGVREWGNYAEDLWLLKRYVHLFRDKHGEDGLFWDPSVIARIAEKASLSKTKTKRKIRAVKSFNKFKTEYGDKLPEGEEFVDQDYFLFENISKKPWVREQLGYGEDDLYIPDWGMDALFEWVFKHPRPSDTSKENPNKFYRHQNIKLWDRMKKYDDKNGTSFASNFDPKQPEEAPMMKALENQWESHKLEQEAGQTLLSLVGELEDFDATELAEEGEAFKKRLERVHELSGKYLRMIEAAESAPAAGAQGDGVPA